MSRDNRNGRNDGPRLDPRPSVLGDPLAAARIEAPPSIAEGAEIQTTQAPATEAQAAEPDTDAAAELKYGVTVKPGMTAAKVLLPAKVLARPPSEPVMRPSALAPSTVALPVRPMKKAAPRKQPLVLKDEKGAFEEWEVASHEAMPVSLNGMHTHLQPGERVKLLTHGLHAIQSMANQGVLLEPVR